MLRLLPYFLYHCHPLIRKIRLKSLFKYWIEWSKIKILLDNDLNPLKFISINGQLKVLRLDGLDSGGIAVKQDTDIRPGVEIDEDLEFEIGILGFFGKLFLTDHKSGDLLMIDQELLFVLTWGFEGEFIHFFFIKGKHAVNVVQHLLFGLVKLLPAYE